MAASNRRCLDNRHPPYPLEPMQSYLVKRDMEKNQAWFYTMAVLPNLFGE